MSEVDDLLREMDREGDGWYGRASQALQSQRQTITQQAQELAEAKSELSAWKKHGHSKEQQLAAVQGAVAYCS